MSDNLIRPRGGVHIPAQQPGAQQQPQTPGMGARNLASPYGAAVDPLANFRSMAEMGTAGGGASSGGAIKWEQYGDSRFEDQAQRDLRNESTIDNDVNQIYINKYSNAAVEFCQFVCARRGIYYEEYRNILENFRLNLRMQTPCAIRSEFVDQVNRHPEMIANIARAALPMYGQRLITIAKTKQDGEVARQEYISAIHFAVRSVLVMELISWLCKSPQGRQKAFSLTPELKQMVGNLENYKDVFGVACATFGVSNPYAGLVYDVKLPTRTDIQLISEAETAYMYNNYSSPASDRDVPIGADPDLQRMISRNANRSRRQAAGGAYGYTPRNEEDDDHRWNKVRTDIQNLTAGNKDEFNLRRYFHSIGKKNHYLISETDWKNIKHAFNRHPEQPNQEETVLRGSFRVVIIDLDNDTGWFSTIVRAEGLDMPMVLTNPEKLLPFLEGDADSGDVSVKQIAAEEALGKKNKTLEIPLETCRELKGIPVVTVKDPIITNSSKKLCAAVTTTNEQMTQNMPHTNATSFNTVIWESFTCEDAGEKTRAYDDLPFLFKDGEEEGKPRSFYEKLRKLSSYILEEQILGEELGDFIAQRLTIMVNEWFVSALGYDNAPNSNEHLSISNILEDFEELNEVLKAENEEGYRWFNAPSGPDNYLTEQMKLFTFEDKYETVTGGSMVQQAQKQLDLILERPIHYTVINKRQGPIADQNGEPLVIKRSSYPEYFDLVEKGFEPTMGVDKSIRTTDKLIQFSADEHLWLFSYTSADRNVATLRRVTRRQSLLFLSLV